MGDGDEELAWIQHCLQGDPTAFEPLVRRYQKRIHMLAFRMTGSLADAEDLAQEVFLQAFRQLHQFRRESRFSTWLHRIAVRHSLHWLAKGHRRERLHQAWAEQVAPCRDFPDAVSGAVQEALLKLPPKQRATLVLTVYDGLSHAEAARILGCSETTVSWRVFAARVKLKRLLSGLMADHPNTP